MFTNLLRKTAAADAPHDLHTKVSDQPPMIPTCCSPNARGSNDDDDEKTNQSEVPRIRLVLFITTLSVVLALIAQGSHAL